MRDCVLVATNNNLYKERICWFYVFGHGCDFASLSIWNLAVNSHFHYIALFKSIQDLVISCMNLAHTQVCIPYLVC